VRFFTTSRHRELDRVRSREREQLARELHDTVAHHVSAMVIRAQAGRVVAAASPETSPEALAALELIEAEGAKTLAEMRFMVGALREPGRVELSPVSGVADIQRLASSVGGELPVEVKLSGEVDALAPAVGAALYRIAQESITNAVRHARRASRVVVEVSVEDERVLLSVSDDGEPVAAGRAGPGYGLAGMTERATLLGGTLTAGPGEPGGGWVVEAVLPRVGSARE
jgi:signal transduction histidine kinase